MNVERSVASGSQFSPRLSEYQESADPEGRVDVEWIELGSYLPTGINVQSSTKKRL